MDKDRLLTDDEICIALCPEGYMGCALTFAHCHVNTQYKQYYVGHAKEAQDRKSYPIGYKDGQRAVIEEIEHMEECCSDHCELHNSHCYFGFDGNCPAWQQFKERMLK